MAAAPVFQDFVVGWAAGRAAGSGRSGGAASDDEGDDEDLQTRLFELANAPAVTYRCRGGQRVTIRQDREAKVHTGGIVWETAFLLGLFLEHQPAFAPAARALEKKPHRVLEVGAGCGLLGVVLAAAGCDVVLTEHPIALPNLQHNVASCGAGVAERARVAQLNWCEAKDVRDVRDAQRARGCPATFDTIVGTDVVFSEQLVAPLLRSVHALAADHTTVWLCLQERCAASHRLMMASIPEYFGSLETIEPAAVVRSDAASCPAEVGTALEALHGQLDCVLLKLTGRLKRDEDTAATATATASAEPPLDGGSGKKRKKSHKEKKGKREKKGTKHRQVKT